MKATASDGSVHEFPEGTDPSVIDRVMGDYAKSLASRSSLTQQFGENMPIVGPLIGKASAAAGAGIQAITNEKPGSTFGERYDANLESEKAASDAYRAQNPKSSAAARIGGAIVGSVPAFAAGPGGVIGTAATGGTLNAADTALRGGDATDIAVQGGIGLLTGGVAGGIGKLLGPAVPKNAGKLSAEDFYGAAEKGYDQLKNLPVVFRPQAVAQLSKDIQGDLVNDRVHDVLAPKTFAVLKQLQDPPKGFVSTFDNMVSLRRVLGKIAGSPDPTEAMAASRAIDTLDKYLASPPAGHVISGDAAAASKVLNEANANYAAGSRLDRIEGKIEAGERRTAASGSGTNADNVLRQNVNSILNSPKLSRGFSETELEEMRAFVKGGESGFSGRNVARLVSKAMGGEGGLMSGVSAIGGAALGHATGLPGGELAAGIGPAIGVTAHRIENKMTDKALQSLLDSIRARAPLSQNQAMMQQLGKGRQPAQTGKMTTPAAAAILNYLAPKPNGATP